MGESEAGEILITEMTPVLRQDYRVFSRGDRLIFGKRGGQVKKYNSWTIVPRRTDRLLGPGAPDAYHSVIKEAISASPDSFKELNIFPSLFIAILVTTGSLLIL